jgi:hypothetical protein
MENMYIRAVVLARLGWGDTCSKATPCLLSTGLFLRLLLFKGLLQSLCVAKVPLDSISAAVVPTIRWRLLQKLVFVICALIRLAAGCDRLDAPVVFKKVKFVGSIF